MQLQSLVLEYFHFLTLYTSTPLHPFEAFNYFADSDYYYKNIMENKLGCIIMDKDKTLLIPEGEFTSCI